MKIQTAMLALCLLTQPLWSQLQRGSLFLGGNFYFQYDSNDPQLNMPISGNDSRTLFSTTASVGVALSPTMALGLGVQYYRESSINSFVLVVPQPSGPFISNKAIYNRWSFRPFIRHYISFAEKAGFFMEAELVGGIGRFKTPMDGFPIDADFYYLGFNLRPAFYFFANDHFCLEAGMGSLSLLHTIMANAQNEFGTGEGDSATSIGIKLSESLGFSFRYFFGKGNSD